MPERRESDPKIAEIERQLTDLIARFTAHESGGKQRSEELKKKLDALDTQIKQLSCDKETVEELDKIVRGTAEEPEGLLFQVVLMKKTMERAERLLWVLLGTGAAYFIVNALEHLFPKGP